MASPVSKLRPALWAMACRGRDELCRQTGRPELAGFAVLSDGECDEGSTWEAAMFAGHHHLDNLIAIIDYNKIQSLGSVKRRLDLEPFEAKWAAFGWGVGKSTAMMSINCATPLAPCPIGGKTEMHHCSYHKGQKRQLHGGQGLWHYRDDRIPRNCARQRAELELEWLMRSAFFNALLEAWPTTDPRINLIIADLGFGVVEPFASGFPAGFSMSASPNKT